MKAMKIRVDNPAHAERLQRALFALCYAWGTGADHTSIRNTDSIGFFTDEGGCITKESYDLAYFNGHDSPLYELVNGVFMKAGSIKPPLGLRPKCIVDAVRSSEIIEAMDRYIAGGLKLPQEWITELADLNAESA